MTDVFLLPDRETMHAVLFCLVGELTIDINGRNNGNDMGP